MKWTIKDKGIIPSILPAEGNLHTKILCRDIREKLTLSADEVKDSGLETNENTIIWKNNIEVKIDFTKDEMKLLKESATKIHDEEKVNDDNLELIEKLLK